MVDWGDYEVYVPPLWGLPSEMTRADARVAYNDKMAHRLERIEMLKTLARLNGLSMEEDPESVDQFGKWLVDEVQEDPEEPERLLPIWYSVVFDTGLYVGDLIIDRNPNLGWTLHKRGKKNVNHQKHVIMGYPTDSRYSVDPDGYVAGLAHRAISGKTKAESPLWDYIVIASED